MVALTDSGIATLTGGSIYLNRGGGVNAGDQGGRLTLGGTIRIFNNYVKENDEQVAMNIHLSNWRNQTPVVDRDNPLTGDALIGLYEGHFFGDPDTYNCVLKVSEADNPLSAADEAELMTHVQCNRAGGELFYDPDCYSNVGYWGHAGYLRLRRAS